MRRYKFAIFHGSDLDFTQTFNDVINALENTGHKVVDFTAIGENKLIIWYKIRFKTKLKNLFKAKYN